MEGNARRGEKIAFHLSFVCVRGSARKQRRRRETPTFNADRTRVGFSILPSWVRNDSVTGGNVKCPRTLVSPHLSLKWKEQEDFFSSNN